MDLFADLKAEIIRVLPHDWADPAVVVALNGMSAFDVAVRFFNWLDRFVSPYPRQVRRSDSYQQRQKPPAHEENLERLIEKMRWGEVLTPHLSRGVQAGFTLAETGAKKNLNMKQDLDMLLNDWGIHHLHLSHEVELDGFVERDGPLLFVIFTAEAAFVLDVIGHGSWTDQHLVAVAVRNWPNEKLFHEINGAMGLSNRLTAEDRKKLRGAGVATLIEVDQKVYISRTMGISASGASGRAVMRAQRLARSLQQFTSQMSADPALFRSAITRADSVHSGSYPAAVK